MSSSTFTSLDMSKVMLKVRNRSIPTWPDPQASISNVDNGITVHGKRYWAVQGPAFDVYALIDKKIMTCLRERENDLYEGLEESFIPHSTGCYMVGTRKENACPYIVIACRLEKFCRQAMNIIKSTQWWEPFTVQHKGFGRFAFLPYPPEHMAKQGTMDSLTMYTSGVSKSFFGAPLFWGSDDSLLDSAHTIPKSTLGGLLWGSNHRCYGLTVAHAFTNRDEMESSRRDEPQSFIPFYEDDISEYSDVTDDGTTSNPSVTVQISSTALGKLPVKERITEGSAFRLGQLTFRSQGTCEDGLDWALMHVEEYGTHFQEEQERLQHMHTSTYWAPQKQLRQPQQIAKASNEAIPVSVKGSDNHIYHGILAPSRSSVCLAGTRDYLLLQSVLLREELNMGDCGAWVYDEDGNWWGHIIAGNPGSRIAYVAAARNIIDSIKEVSGLELEPKSPTSIVDRFSTAASGGYHDILLQLIDPLMTTSTSDDIQRALEDAAKYGYADIIAQMIQAGADVGCNGNTALHAACEKGQIEVIKLLLEAGAKIDGSSLQRRSALFAASEAGHAEAVRLLLEAGANVNASMNDGQSALFVACSAGHTEIVKLLLEAGAKFNERYEVARRSPLTVASWRGNVETVRLLIKAGASLEFKDHTNRTSLYLAAEFGHASVIEVLIDAGADVNVWATEDTALYIAASRGHTEVVKLLVHGGANIDENSGYHGNALQAAIWHEKRSTVEFLINTGAKPILPWSGFENSLQLAANYGKHESVRMLIDFGADVNDPGQQLGTALHIAAIHHDEPATMKILIEAGADPNLVSGHYGTPLQAACSNAASVTRFPNEPVILFLLDVGIDVNIQAGEFGTALQAASTRYGRPELVRMLLEKGADPNLSGGTYGTALQAAAATYFNKDAIVRLLLGKNADVNIVGGMFGTALQAAVFYSKERLVRLLLERGADVNASGGVYGSAIQAAASANHVSERIIQMLLAAGADVNATGGEYGSALGAARHFGHTHVVEILLERGAIDDDSMGVDDQ